jgi:membrane protein involved in colicin uptake
MEEDKEQRERDPEAKKRRMEEAAKQAALMREQYRAQAEAEAKAKAEAKAEREAAEAAAKEARDRQRAEAARAAEIAARQAAQLAEAAAAKQSAAKAAKRDATEPPSSAASKAAAAAAAAPPAKRGRPSKAAAAAAAAASKPAASKPASFSLPAALAAPNANLMQMPDDFAGLYAVRASDDATRLAASAKGAAAKDPGSYASMKMRVELRRNASDGGAGLLSAPHVMVSGSAPVGVLKQLVATQVGGQVTREAVRVTAEDGGPGEAADLGADVAVADALFEQIAAGEKNLSLRYSVV